MEIFSANISNKSNALTNYRQVGKQFVYFQRSEPALSIRKKYKYNNTFRLNK